MNCKERLMATLRGEFVDRPAVNLYEIGGLVMDARDGDRFNVYNDPSWQPLLELAENHTDIIRMRSPVRAHSHQSWEATQTGKSIRDEFFQTRSYEKNGCRMTHTTLTIAGRSMTSRTRREPDVDTIWTTEPLLKSKDDVRAYLQLPDEVFHETVDITPLLREEKDLGDRGIVMVDTEDPLCAAATLFGMEDYTIVALTEQKLFHQLLEKLARTIWQRTERVAREFPGRVWRIYGPEFATEPYLPPRLFEAYVVRYSGPMVRMIQQYGGFARIHSHGRIQNVLDHIVAMGADAIDPIEPPGAGDVSLKMVRENYGNQLVLFGNIEVADIENLPHEKFAELVDNTLREGTSGSGRGFVLMPTASPVGRKITDRTRRNYEILVQRTIEFTGH